MKLSGVVLTIVGALLIALSFVWTTLNPPTSYWTEEQAAEHAKAGTTYHRLALGGHEHAKGTARGKPQPPVKKEELEAARLRWEASKAALTAAQTKSSNTALWLRGIGAAFGLVGIGCLLIHKRQTASGRRDFDSC
jgi:hypothetical protein